ncbi:hypothetical protein TVAG_168370 [Trichomonas vaginalis G3]|uniref:Deoxynucleoside kinase domain-containing protein n=1 Tax=Trichomonas vaginalis (strain ATCC PRA-98 / G3) TaxID=412133 RepID=A2F2E0_TRIV3|nr:deoxynucleoside kinase family [Trichomonas vaginalis G3]EAY00906.1 hypothetical protein TVAG_168370 [Trichomonas vaginalis G3]KAI5554149.1 deoxynucleoside kinase family [Trichomonas vaginalis G3]|eukprot:XP_001313835.1 hypothetical protein [Trichomonas vaginalis G3]
MKYVPIVITGPIGAGKLTLARMISKHLAIDYVKEYIDINDGEEMLLKFKANSISSQDFQEYILQTYKSQLMHVKGNAFIMERLPEEGSIIFSNSDKSILERAVQVQEEFDIYGYKGEATVLTIHNSGQSTEMIMNEVLCTLFGTKHVSREMLIYLKSLNGIIIYLRTTPEMCIERIRRRNRFAEKSITLDDMKEMCKKYDTYINSFKNYYIQ